MAALLSSDPDEPGFHLLGRTSSSRSKAIRGQMMRLSRNRCAHDGVGPWSPQSWPLPRFNALTLVQAYKSALAMEEAINFLYEQSGSHFDSRLELFIGCLPQILQIKKRWAEQSGRHVLSKSCSVSR